MKSKIAALAVTTTLLLTRRPAEAATMMPLAADDKATGSNPESWMDLNSELFDQAPADTDESATSGGAEDQTLAKKKKKKKKKSRRS